MGLDIQTLFFYHRGIEVDACDLNVGKRLGHQF